MDHIIRGEIPKWGTKASLSPGSLTNYGYRQNEDLPVSGFQVSTPVSLILQLTRLLSKSGQRGINSFRDSKKMFENMI